MRNEDDPPYVPRGLAKPIVDAWEKRPAQETKVDFLLYGKPHNTVWALSPQTPAAKAWVKEHVEKGALCLGDTIAVEHRYIDQLIEGLVNDGLTWQPA